MRRTRPARWNGKHPGGRPTVLTPELGERLLKLILTELISVRAAMQRVGRAPSQVHRWKKMDAQFRDQYERAFDFRTDLQLDEIIEIADDCRPGMVRKAKLQIDARKWIVSRMMPKLARGQAKGLNAISSFILTVDRHLSWHFVKEVPASLSSFCQ